MGKQKAKPLLYEWQCAKCPHRGFAKGRDGAEQELRDHAEEKHAQERAERVN